VANWAGYFDGRLTATGRVFLPDGAESAATYTGEVNISPKTNSSTGLYVGADGKNDCYVTHVDGGSPGLGNWALYVSGGAYGLYSTSADNLMSGDLTVSNDLTASTLSLSDAGFGPSCGEATVAALADTVRVTTIACTAEADNVVNITPVDRSPSGTTPYVVLRSGSFTIHCSENQAADQKFYWVLVKR
jgi:hypothetical protein